MLNEKKVVPKLRQKVKVKFDIVTRDDIKIYYTGKFQDFTDWYIIKDCLNIVTYVTSLFIMQENLLSHSNPSFPCDIAVSKFLVLKTFEIRFYEVIDCTVHMFTS